MNLALSQPAHGENIRNGVSQKWYRPSSVSRINRYPITQDWSRTIEALYAPAKPQRRGTGCSHTPTC